MVLAAFSSASSQTSEKVEPQASDSSPPKLTSAVEETNSVRTTAEETPEEPEVWIHLVGGRRVQVDELTELADGFWYKRGNVSTFLERESVTRVERITATKPNSVADPSRSTGSWKLSDAGKVGSFFMERFGRRLPVGAFGQSDLHNRWGLDHRNSMDVSLHPDSPEGRALIAFLRSEGIPFLAFRGPIPGVSTGPHIHVGNPSPRVGRR